MTHLSEEDLVLIYYAEPGVGEDARAHLAACPQCQTAADSLAQTLNLCAEFSVPEPDAGFERRVWSPRPRILSMPPVWIGVAASVILLVGAFFAGRASRTPQPQPAILAGLSAQARQRILEISLADHFDRAGIVLTEISNNDDVAGERGRAQDLVEEGRLLRQTLALRGNTATLAVFDDIQRALLEIVHADSSESPEIVRHIGESSLVFKARIMETNLRTQGQRL